MIYKQISNFHFVQKYIQYQMKSNKSQQQEPFLTRKQFYFEKDKYFTLLDSIPQQLYKQLQKYTQQICHEYVYQQIYGARTSSQLNAGIGALKMIEVIKNIDTFVGTNFLGYREGYAVSFSIKFSHISNITFKNLKWLNFRFCCLFSIEDLTWLNMKSLKSLKLQKNYIVSLKPLGKTLFRQLTNLNISYNRLSYHSIDHLHRFFSQKLQFISVIQNIEPCCFQNPIVFVKLYNQNRWPRRNKSLQVSLWHQQKIIQRKPKFKQLIRKHTLIVFK